MLRIRDLSLVREQQPAFFIGWTIMHVIDESSPLCAESEESLQRSGAGFLLSLSGTDDTTGHVLMARHNYPCEAIRWTMAFRDVLDGRPEGVTHFDYARFHDVDELPPANG